MVGVSNRDGSEEREVGGEDGERHAYPPALNEVGFFEDWVHTVPAPFSAKPSNRA